MILSGQHTVTWVCMSWGRNISYIGCETAVLAARPHLINKWRRENCLPYIVVICNCIMSGARALTAEGIMPSPLTALAPLQINRAAAKVYWCGPSIISDHTLPSKANRFRPFSCLPRPSQACMPRNLPIHFSARNLYAWLRTRSL